MAKKPYIQREYIGTFMGGGIGANFNEFAFEWLAGYQYINSIDRNYNAGLRIYGSYNYMKILGVDCNLLLINTDIIFDFIITNNFLMGLYIGKSWGIGASSNKKNGKEGGIVALPTLQVGLRFNFLTHNNIEFGIHGNIMIRATEPSTQTTRFLARYIYSF